MDFIKKMSDEMETANGFFYLGYMLIASGSYGPVVTARVRVGWIRFRKY